jgi:poly-gamma-glutamate capsule biosynthesis protein CapA/YwtB (metallophosphatase superfamily)
VAVSEDPLYAARRARRAERRRQIQRRRRIALGVLVVALAIAGYAIAGRGSGGSNDAAGTGQSSGTGGSTGTGTTTPSASGGGSTTSSTTTKTKQPPPSGDFTMTAVGDTMLGNTPDLPPSPSTYFSAVETPLRQGAQVVFGNLEGTLTDATAGKCGSNSSNCYQFHAPPSFAEDLKDAGFTIMNNANNHSYDFGPVGQAQTVHALHRAGLAQTGLPGQITVVHANGIRVAYVGFAPYSDTASLTDIPAAEKLIRKAATEADVVVVYMHAGAEGTQYQHVTGQEEIYFGEDRGNPEAFAHAAVDAGADLVIASGPHVVRGMQFYHHHLIAYSLGNFAGYSNYEISGDLGVSCILRVKLTGAGDFVSAKITPVELVGKGQPVPGGPAISEIAALSNDDFGGRAATISADGEVTPPS